MTQSEPARTESHSFSPQSKCPGLDPEAHWDEPQALRGEIYVADNLVTHAAELARLHGEPTLRLRSALIWQRFLNVRGSIREAYAILTERHRNNKDPSPAEEWLLDNGHVIEEQVREIKEDLPRGYLRELPRLGSGAMRGYPRVYALCLDYLRHTDARLDPALLSEYVLSYQSVHKLTIGELWAVPIMLRLGLLLTVGTLATAEATSGNRARADAWADRLIGAQKSPVGLGARLIELESKPINAAFLVQLLRRLREQDESGLGIAFDWINVQSQKLGSTPEELVRLQHLRQAADQVSVGNAVTSMRAVAAFDWNEFFDRTSAVETRLRKDPCNAYAKTDKASRNRYRHAVEAIARRSPASEEDVAEAAVQLAREAHARDAADVTRSHVGYYLVDDGRRALESAVKYRKRLRELVPRAVLSYPSAYYFGLFSLLLAGIWLFCAWQLLEVAPRGPALLGLLCLMLLPASEVAVTAVNAITVALTKPRLLTRLALKDGVPSELRTLVVVPSLLDNERTLRQLLEDLEVRSLANREGALHFALLTDFSDADSAERPEDAELLRTAVAGIADLNARYPDIEHRYALFHRKRQWNESEQRFMGWERKRGKLEELNRLLRGAKETSFTLVSAPRELLASVRYVITLDADTELPRDVAQKLVGTLAHPLNRPEFDAETQRRVVRGYGIAQPRVGTLPLSSRRSRLAAISAGRSGIDPYTTAVSDVYQDLFGEGSFVGKGIYDVDAFMQALAGRVPENRLLSHDLFEGIYARSALVTDIEVLDEQPASYEVQVARQHRWIRGDWQLLPWLTPYVPSLGGRKKGGFRLIDSWKVLDNLRRSMLAPALIGCCVLAWLLSPAAALGVTLGLGVVFFLPVVGRFILSLLRESTRSAQPFLGGLGGDLRTNLVQICLSVAFLLDQALVSLDATSRTIVRLFKKRRLLEWTTMGQTARRWTQRGHRVAPRMWLGAGLALVMLAVIAVVAFRALPFALPVAGAWALAPFLALWLSKPLAVRRAVDRLTQPDRQFLRLTARKTWRFFETFVTAEDHFLPPDNYQEDPRGVVAHRTSPTNIGLYLLSSLAARDFGFITLRQMLERNSRTLTTIEELPRRDGHILNWYDTLTLRPLDPQYVSTVDSGNLAAYLWTLREACNGLKHAPLVSSETLRAVVDALQLAKRGLKGKRGDTVSKAIGKASSAIDALETRVAAAITASNSTPATILTELVELTPVIDAIAKEAADLPEEAIDWLERASETARSTHEEGSELLAFLDLLDTTPQALESGELGEAWRKLTADLRILPSLDAVLRGMPNFERRVDDLERGLERLEDKAARSEALTFIAELRASLRRSASACSELEDGLSNVGSRAGELADGMNFRFLLDEHRELFVTGYNVSGARLDTSHYDLLASEARLASLVAIAKGDVPQEHWFRLGRPGTRVNSHRAVLSWSGSMFEYLMPLLVTKSHPDTLLDETCIGAVERQREYAAERGVPWGVSEAAYNVMDMEFTYQYRAFGVPGLGLKSGLGEDLVIAPYATALATLVDAPQAVKNLRTLAKEGLDGEFGFYEAIDYSPSRVPPGRKGVIVKSYMAHHHGMSLVAIDNVLHDGIMQQRFHSDARVKATELLLEERVPVNAPLFTIPAAALVTKVEHTFDLDLTEHVRLGTNEIPRAHLLGHGSLSTLVTATGTGSLTFRGLDVNRFREDAVLEAGGIYVYIRNLSDRKLWSAGYQPTRVTPDYYDAAFSIDHVELSRRDGDIETVMEIVPSAEHAAEVRRITLTNHGARARELDVTTYMEVVLQSRGGDLAHRAFGSMFIETEALPQYGALLARRRPRSSSESEVWVVQVLAPLTEGWSQLEYDSSRPDFVGRGGTLEQPSALIAGAALSRRTGCVLDPALVLSRRIKLESGQRSRVALTTAMAQSRDEAMRLAENYAEGPSIPRAFELGWADARVELRHLRITAAQSHRFQKLLSAILFPQPSLRADVQPSQLRGKGKEALWARGVSGDLPIMVLRVDTAELSEICRELLLAHEFWRVNGIAVDFVIINEEPSGYLQPLQLAILDQIRSSHSEGHVDQPGGVFPRRADQIADNDRALLLSMARVVLTCSGGSLARQLTRAGNERKKSPETALLPAARASSPRIVVTPAPARRELLFDNGFGGFSTDGREYVMVLGPSQRTPAPWCNVIANPRFGTVVTESGSSYTWFSNAQRHRLTPWSNDAVCDPSGEVIYLRDDEDGSVWSATPRPAGGDEHYVVSHGQGYSRFEHTRNELSHELVTFVSPHDAVKISRLRIENRGSRARRLSVFGVIEWVLGATRDAGRLSVVTSWDAEARTLFASNAFSIFPEGNAFFTTTRPVRGMTASRDEFFGLAGSRSRPSALDRSMLSGRAGVGLDPLAALDVPLKLAPGESVELSFVLGQGDDVEHSRALAATYREEAAVARAWDEALSTWNEILGAVEVKTPDPALDVMVNRWLLYQALCCRIWARTGFYQSSGAYGYRDQVQDVLSLLHTRPALAREHLLRAAARQFREGDVQHWWHAETGDGVRTHYSDDMLWLPFATAEYVRATGDRAILDEQIPFLAERLLAPADHDIYSVPAVTEEKSSLYEHCTRALDIGTTSGPHGLPLMGGGDWNDGMNRVGAGGQGESVWLGWFLIKTLKSFSALAVARGDAARVAKSSGEIERLTQAIETHAWDGAWYRRAYFDDGTPLGTHSASECRIDAIAQSWATIAGTGDKERAARALRESETLLVREHGKMLLLLAPPFEQSTPDPGYIQAYPAGIRENGGQYTHGVLWTLQALALSGEADRAARLFTLLNPVHHAENREDALRYRVEPYVVAADIYSARGHLGRGGWTWYTGAAGWMYRIVVEDLLGLKRRGDRLLVEPCVPGAWQRFEVTYRYGKSVLHIVIENPSDVSSAGKRVEVDGRAVPDGAIPLIDDGKQREVRVSLGEARLRSSA
jgi:cyclic beta-1,2-glucan synthetase